MFFQNTIIKNYLAMLNDQQVKAAWEQYKEHFLNPQVQERIRTSKEEQYQEGFLRDLFVQILGYTMYQSGGDYNLITEKKNETDSKKADGAILRDDKVIGIIELKDHKTPNLKQVETQAFGYKNQHRGTHYVIISNFEKLRFYIDDTTDYKEWDLFALKEEDFKELYFCLSWGTLSQDLPIKAKTESVSNEDRITQQLYRDYSAFKRELFADILKNNTTDETPQEQILLLFKKTQKLLDRLLFIFFAEDCYLLPSNMMIQIINDWEKLKELDEYKPLYDLVKKYFGYLDAGNDKRNIFAYNGGLFKPDEELDGLIISDELLVRHTRKLSDYDYASEVDVNILGHIFENSLSEIEEVTAQINAGEAPTVSKRKRDGVFYTPQYITKYIVENTVGRLCTEKKAEMGIDETEYFADKNRQMATKKRLLDKLDAYREWLKGISICDPACGSGAFLNAALHFLVEEHKLINEMEAKVAGASIPYGYYDNMVLENNLFGVDINEESVEIAKLALWLRTAQPHRKLSSLNNNIKCGNSLIGDPEIGGDKAFNWQAEFPQVFAKGGFDIVIGNPPYVQLQSMGKMSDAYAQCGYEVYNKMGDLYCLFYEQGCKLLRNNGYLGFIASNKWLKINYGESLRKYLITNVNPIVLIDFPGVPVFEDATVDPQILIVQKQQYNGKTFACAIKAKHENILDFVESHKISLNLTSEPWTIRDSRITDILKKMDSCGKALKDLPIDINYGIKTGYNEAYFIDQETKDRLIKEHTSSAEMIRPLLRGRDIGAWYSVTEDQYIIFVPWHFPLHLDTSIQGCSIEAEKAFEERYPAIYAHLLSHKDKLSARNKAETGIRYEWYASQRWGADYYEDFAKKKIVYPNMTKYLPFSYDETGAICNDKAFIITSKEESFSLKYLLAILNTSIVKFWIRCVCPELGEDRREVRKVYFENLHIPETDQQPFVELADTMLALKKELQETRSRFIRRLQDNIPEVKINGALEAFDSLDFNGFVSELKKQKIRLSLFQQDEWEKYFNKNKQDCEELSAKIAETDKEINARVYTLYGLEADEIKLIEQ